MFIISPSTKSPFFTDTDSMPPAPRGEKGKYLIQKKQRNLSEIPLRPEVIENIVEDNKTKLLDKNIKLLKTYTQKNLAIGNNLPSHIFNDLKKFFGDVLEVLTHSNQKESLQNILEQYNLTPFVEKFEKRIENYRTYLKAELDGTKNKLGITLRDDAKRLKYTHRILELQSLPHIKSPIAQEFILKNAEKWFDFPVTTLKDIHKNIKTLENLLLRPDYNNETSKKNKIIKNYIRDNLEKNHEAVSATKNILELGYKRLNDYILDKKEDWFHENSLQHIKNFSEFMCVIDKEDISDQVKKNYIKKAFENPDKLDFVIENYKKNYNVLNEFIFDYISDNINKKYINEIFDNIKINEKNFSRFSGSEQNIFAFALEDDDAEINNSTAKYIFNEKIRSYICDNIHHNPLKLKYTIDILLLNDKKMEDLILKPRSQWLDNSAENLEEIYLNVCGNHKRLEEIEKDNKIVSKEKMIDYVVNNIDKNDEKVRYTSYILGYNNQKINFRILDSKSKWLNKSKENITDIYQNMHANTNFLKDIHDEKSIPEKLKNKITSYINDNITRHHNKMTYLVEKLKLNNLGINNIILNPHFNLIKKNIKEIENIFNNFDENIKLFTQVNNGDDLTLPYGLKKEIISYIDENITESHKNMTYLVEKLKLNNLGINNIILNPHFNLIKKNIKEIENIFNNFDENIKLFTQVNNGDDLTLPYGLKREIISYIDENITESHKNMTYLVEKLKLNNPSINNVILNPHFNLLTFSEKDLRSYIDSVEATPSTTSRNFDAEYQQREVAMNEESQGGASSSSGQQVSTSSEEQAIQELQNLVRHVVPRG